MFVRVQNPLGSPLVSNSLFLLSLVYNFEKSWKKNNQNKITKNHWFTFDPTKPVSSQLSLIIFIKGSFFNVHQYGYLSKFVTMVIFVSNTRIKPKLKRKKTHLGGMKICTLQLYDADTSRLKYVKQLNQWKGARVLWQTNTPGLICLLCWI